MEKIRRCAHRAKDAGAELVIFPEICLTGYWHVRNLTRDQIGHVMQLDARHGPFHSVLSKIPERADSR
ncbi:MAG: hypothetical protein AAF514_06200 [Verrucomicrobiota bacterium]